MLQQCARESVHPAYGRFRRMKGYHHPVLLNKLQKELQITRKQAQALFEDVKRFLALCVGTPQPLAPTTRIDQGWHQFILFTQDYRAFCENYCGRFVHHVPEDPFAVSKDYESVPRTVKLATLVYGRLSSNWNLSGMSSAECTPQSCQGKDCSPNDCTSCKTA